MICVSDLRDLTTQWTDRIKSQEHDASYCDAVSDCIFDLKNLVSSLDQEEAEACDPYASMSDKELKELYEDMQADDYLMSEHYF